MEKTLGIFHKFIWFIWMPLSLWTAVTKAFSVISTSYINYAPFEHGGALLLLFIIQFVCELFFVAAPILIFIGFFHQKKYAWIILLLLSITNVFFSPILMIIKAGSYNSAQIIGKTLGIAIDIIIIAYYWKRKHLFGIGKARHNPENIQQTQTKYIYCSNCGQQLEAGDKYCSRCGAKVK